MEEQKPKKKLTIDELTEVQYFQKNLFQALKVPKHRWPEEIRHFCIEE